jgi:hypothetical protein
MDGSWSPPPKRRSQRVPIDLPVVIERAGAQFDGRTLNLGLGGAFIQTAEKLAYGEQVELWLALPEVALLCPLRSVVRWTSNFGFGVQFLEVGAREVFALNELMNTAGSDDRLTLTNLEADLLLEVSPHPGA